jgi:hypothetical protein
MELLGDMGQVEARFDTFGDSVNLDARYVHGSGRTYISIEIFLGHSMELLVTWVK